MSEKLKVGDRVRLTYVGTVKSVYRNGGSAMIDGSGRQFAWTDDVVESVEKLARTYGRGTVAVDRSDPTGDPVVRTEKADRWLDLNGTRTGYTDHLMERHVAEGIRVLVHEPTT